jgi:hypothetical protein
MQATSHEIACNEIHNTYWWLLVETSEVPHSCEEELSFPLLAVGVSKIERLG